MDFQITTKDIEKQRVKRSALSAAFAVALFFVFLVAPQKAFSQSFNPLISFSVKACTLDEALEKLFAEYELNVAFSKAELSKIRIEDYSCSYKSLEEVLTDLLRGTDYGYKKIGKQYVISKKQPVVPVVEAPQEEPDLPPKETIEAKTDIVVNKTADTVRVIDTIKVIRTVMRYDTVVRVEQVTDTVYEVKYRGYVIQWPDFRNNGWFVAPWMTIGALKLDYEHDEDILAPVSTYALGLDGGFKHERWTAGMSFGYRSAKYSFSFDKTVTEGGYYVNDTLDTYYVIHQGNDTTYHYILDSTYMPMTTTNYAWRDVNRLDYLSIGLFASFDFLKLEPFRMYVKAGIMADILLDASGSYYEEGTPMQKAISRDHASPVNLAYFGGIGAALKVGDHVELVPEFTYRGLAKSVYKTEFPLDLRMHQWDFRLGLTYYF